MAIEPLTMVYGKDRADGKESVDVAMQQSIAAVFPYET